MYIFACQALGQAQTESRGQDEIEAARLLILIHVYLYVFMLMYFVSFCICLYFFVILNCAVHPRHNVSEKKRIWVCILFSSLISLDFC